MLRCANGLALWVTTALAAYSMASGDISSLVAPKLVEGDELPLFPYLVVELQVNGCQL